MLSLGIIATTTRSASLANTPDLASRLASVALRSRDLPCFGSSTILMVPPPIRRSRRRLHWPVAFIDAHWPSPLREWARLLETPRPVSVGSHFDAVVFALAAAP